MECNCHVNKIFIFFFLFLQKFNITSITPVLFNNKDLIINKN